jgi:hypothetical protein
MLFLTARDIARILNISKSATYQIIQQSEIPVVRINRNVCLSVIIFPCVIRYSTPPIPALNGSLVPSPPNAIFITIFSLIVIQLYRQFVLHQPQEAWNDIAMLLTANIHFLLGLTLYLTGAINPREIKLRNILVGYALFVLVGFLFTTFKYAVLLGQEINLLQVWDSLSTVVIISGVLMLALGLLAYLGNRRIDKQIS